MRKDDAISIILNSYIAWLHGECGEHSSKKDLAKLILSNLEKAGMQPPNRHVCLSHDCEHSPDNTWDKK